MRMKFLRILPETCARTWCLFSSSTRNMAFGSGSITVAMTSMASSFGFPESPFFLSSNCFAIVSCSFPYHDGPVISFGLVRIHGPSAGIAEAVARAHLVDRAVQRFAGHLQELLDFRPNPPDWNRDRRIRVVAVHFHPEIDGDDVAFSQLPLR